MIRIFGIGVYFFFRIFGFGVYFFFRIFGIGVFFFFRIFCSSLVHQCILQQHWQSRRSPR